MSDICETKKKEIFIGNLIFAGFSKRYVEGKLTHQSVHINILGGEEVSFPSVYWDEVRSAIDRLLLE